jgi:uncharacterized protein YbcI
MVNLTPLSAECRAARRRQARDSTGFKPVSLHHDISTSTGEEVVIFTPADSPSFREARKR